MSDAGVVTIFGMALVTYATRGAGLWLGNRLRLGPRFDAVLSALPGAILVSLVAPAIVAAGWPGLVAAVATVLVALWMRGNILIPMLVGMAVVSVLRLL